jgi:hypothetical protein
MFDWIKKNLTGRLPAVDPFKQFVREFVGECEQQDVQLKNYDPQARAFVVRRDDGSEMTCQLYNVFGEWRSRSPDGRPELIAMFVQSLVETQRCNVGIGYRRRAPAALRPSFIRQADCRSEDWPVAESARRPGRRLLV